MTPSAQAAHATDSNAARAGLGARAVELPRSLAAGGADVNPAAQAALDRMGPRELRRLPRIGQTRALAIARDRWERGTRGGLGALERVSGIGPETVKQVREWLKERWRSP